MGKKKGGGEGGKAKFSVLDLGKKSEDGGGKRKKKKSKKKKDDA